MDNIILRIKADYNKLSKREKTLADWVLKNTECASHSTSREVAKACGCSAPTVVRFAVRFGFETFTDFKIALAVALKDDVNVEEIDKKDGFSVVYSKVLGELGRDSVMVKNFVSDNLFEAFARKLSAEKNIKTKGINAEVEKLTDGESTALLIFENDDFSECEVPSERFYLITDKEKSELAQKATATLFLPFGTCELTKVIIAHILKIRIEENRSVRSIIKFQ